MTPAEASAAVAEASSAAGVTAGLSEDEKLKLKEAQEVLTQQRQTAEKVFVGVRSKSQVATLLKEQLGRCVQEVLDKCAQLKQLELFGALPGQPPCTTSLLKSVLVESFQVLEQLKEATGLCRSLAGGGS